MDGRDALNVGQGMRAGLSCEQHGFSKISNLTGGVHAWAQQVDDTMPTY